MSIEVAEQRKQEWTDKYVVVDEGVPELRRFVGLTGTVKTVNMNGQALVQFDGPEDISWYDIDPGYLTVVEAPVKKKSAPAKQAKASSAEAKPAAKGSKPSGGKSPLELARQQGAAGKAKPAAAATKAGGGKSPLELAREQGAAGAAKPAADAKPAGSEAAGKKLSPLELARQQGAVKQGTTAKAESAATPAAKTTTTDAPGKKLSPLELARQQDGAGTAKSTAAADEESTAVEPTAVEPTADEPTADEPTAVEPTAAESAEELPAAAPEPTPTTGPDGKPLSIIELARQQGAFKG